MARIEKNIAAVESLVEENPQLTCDIQGGPEMSSPSVLIC